MKVVKLLAVCMLVATVVTGCGGFSSEGDNHEGLFSHNRPTPPTPPLGKSVNLKKFNSLTEMETFIKETMIASSDASLDDDVENGCKSYDYYDGLVTAGGGSGPVTAPASSDGQENEGGAVAFTDTNVQEKGVDEADIVKTSGDYLFVLSGEKLHIIKTWPLISFKEMAVFTIEGSPISMYVFEDQVAIFSEKYGYEDCSVSSWGGEGSPECVGKTSVKLTVLDITSIENPSVVRESYYDGFFVSSRRIGGSLYIILNDNIDVPYVTTGVSWNVLPECNDEGKPSINSSASVVNEAEGLKKTNRETVSEWNLDVSELPGMRKKAGQIMQDIAVNPASFNASELAFGNNMVGVIKVDLSDLGSEDQAEYILGDSSTEVYASMGSLYVASQDYVDGNTMIHRFELGEEVSYFGTAYVGGWLLDQFSMSENDGFLRVVTTEGHANKGEMEVSSTLYVVSSLENDMPVVGGITGIGEDEEVKSVRFIGKKGYVVTFKKIDPLFVIDVENPLEPVLEGELKVPGFSTYLHPLDENHLIGLGKDADDQGDFAWFQGLKLSIFDVTDAASPKEDASIIIGDRGTMSPAFDNHLAFTFDNASGLLALPLTLCQGEWGGNDNGKFVYNGAQVYNVNKDSGFSLVGEIKETLKDGDIDEDEWNYYSPGCNGWHYDGKVKRTVIMSEGTDQHVLTISDDGVKLYSKDGDLEAEETL